MKNIVFSVLEEYGLTPDHHTDADLDDLEYNYFVRGGFFGIIEDENNEIVGTMGLYNIDNKSCEIRKMYFISKVRGLGLGKFTLNYLISLAKAKRFETIELQTASVLKEAVGLYKKFGFRPFESNHLAPRCDQAYWLALGKPQTSNKN